MTPLKSIYNMTDVYYLYFPFQSELSRHGLPINCIHFSLRGVNVQGFSKRFPLNRSHDNCQSVELIYFH